MTGARGKGEGPGCPCAGFRSRPTKIIFTGTVRTISEDPLPDEEIDLSRRRNVRKLFPLETFRSVRRRQGEMSGNGVSRKKSLPRGRRDEV